MRRAKLVLTIGLLALMSMSLSAGEGARPQRAALSTEVDWSSRLEQKLQDLRKDGYPLSWDQFRKTRPEIPDDRNSALILLEAFENFPKTRFALRLHFPPSENGKVCSEEFLKLVERELKDNREFLDQVHRIAPLDRGMYPLNISESPFGSARSHLPYLRKTMRLVGAEAVVHVAAGQPKRAAKSLTVLSRVVTSPGDPPWLVDALVRNAISLLHVGATERVLGYGELPPESLRALRSGLLREGDRSFLSRALSGDFLSGHRAFAHIYTKKLKEMDAWDELSTHQQKQARQLLEDLRARDELLYVEYIHAVLRVVDGPETGPRAEALREELNQLVGELEKLSKGRERMSGLRKTRTLARAAQAAATAKNGKEAVEAFNSILKDLWPRHMVTLMLAPAGPRAIGYQKVRRMHCLVAAAALAAEEFRLTENRWPKSLQELVPKYLEAIPRDVFGEGPVQYKPTKNAVRFYSVGKDRVDNGGLAREEVQRRIEAGEAPEDWKSENDPGDVVFTLLDPERRGAVRHTFREDIMRLHVGFDELKEAGYTREELRKKGLSGKDIKGW